LVANASAQRKLNLFPDRITTADFLLQRLA
jgi:hypothetical protein